MTTLKCQGGRKRSINQPGLSPGSTVKSNTGGIKVKIIYFAVASVIANIALFAFSIATYMSYQDYVEYPAIMESIQAGHGAEIESIKTKNVKLARSLKKKTDEMSACVKAVVGVESDFDQMFHSVEDASLMEVTFYADTESGEPRKFVIRGCQKEEVKK